MRGLYRNTTGTRLSRRLDLPGMMEISERRPDQQLYKHLRRIISPSTLSINRDIPTMGLKIKLSLPPLLLKLQRPPLPRAVLSCSARHVPSLLPRHMSSGMFQNSTLPLDLVIDAAIAVT